MTVYPDVKINLGLNILGRRPDGYHDLETLFVPFRGMGDRIDIEESDRGSVEVIGGDWDPETDLSWRACRLLSGEFGLPPVRIVLHKAAPVGAGLGSGSADAAFTLKALNEMFSLGLDEAALASRAAMLGSDCPFFIYDRPMFGEGRGEKLTPCELDLSSFEIRVEVPAGVKVSTREAYSGLDLSRAGERKPLREVLSRPVEEWRESLTNDFEPSVFAVHPQIAALKDRFYAEGAVYASMSGSGSAVFGLFRKLVY